MPAAAAACAAEVLQLGNGGITFDGGTESATLADCARCGSPPTPPCPTPLVTSAAGPAIFDTQGFTVLDTQPITGGGPLQKLGAGVLNLVAASTYSGGTSIVAGQVGAYNNAALGAGAVTLAGGNLVTGALAGLEQGSLIGSTNTSSVNPANAPSNQGGSIVPGFTTGSTAAENAVNLSGAPSNTGPDPVQSNVWWGTNNTWVYTGYFFSVTGQVAAAEQIDDNTVLVIDGQTVLNDNQWNVATSTGLLNLGMGPKGDGWHSIELRVSNGGGGAGPSAQGTGWTTSYGFGFQGSIGNAPALVAGDVAAGQNVNGGDYAPVTDPGNGSVFRVGYATNLTNAIVLGPGGGSIDVTGGTTVTLSGTVSGGTLNKIDSGTLVLLGGNTYSGGTTVAAGTLASNNATALGTPASVNVASGATLSVGASQSVAAVTGSGAVTLNGNTLTVNNSSGLSSTFAGTIANGTASGAVVKAGSGTFTLTGTEAYTGSTTVSAGSLIVNGSLTSSTVSVTGSGILGGVGSVGSVINNGSVNPGASGAPGTLNIAGSLTLGTGNLVIDLSKTAADSVRALSSVNLTGATLSLNVGAVTTGEAFTILNVPGSTGGVTGTFVGLDGTPGHNTITAGGTVFTISYTGGDGNDIILTATGTATSILSHVLNGGIPYVNTTPATNQHSMVENVVYSFSQAVSLSASDFTLSGYQGTPASLVPNVNVTGSGTVWTVTFSGVGVNMATHSIGDGEYQLVLSGVPGLANDTYDFFRLLGDMDGSGTVDTSDFTAFISTFLSATTDPLYLGADDFDRSGGVDASDFSQFTANFLKSVPTPLPN